LLPTSTANHEFKVTMARAFCIPGLFFLFAAFVLSFLVSISLPYLPAMDIARVHFGSGASSASEGVIEGRFGIWALCDYLKGGEKVCSATSHGYSASYYTQNGITVVIGSSWTRGLAVHPVATAVTFVALLLAFSTHITVTLVSSLVSFLAALLTMIAFAIDIALFVYIRHQTDKLTGTGARTNPAPGFWMTFVTLLLLLLGGCTVCFGRRRDRMSGASTYPTTAAQPSNGFFSRFRRQPKY
jgi:hypothetical protein